MHVGVRLGAGAAIFETDSPVNQRPGTVRDHPRSRLTRGLGSWLSFELKDRLYAPFLLVLVDSAGVNFLGAGESAFSPLGVPERLIDLSRLPEPKEQDGELAGHRHHRPLLAILAALRG